MEDFSRLLDAYYELQNALLDLDLLDEQSVENLSIENDFLQHRIEKLEMHNSILENENTSLREALEFYAEQKNYSKCKNEIHNCKYTPESMQFYEMDLDRGKLARKVLEGL